MESEFFSNVGITPQFHFESTTPMEFQAAAAEFNSEQKMNFDSALSSMVSSPMASNSNIKNKSFVIRELIGKLGNIGNSGEISPQCYCTPLTSPAKLNLIKNQLPKSRPLNSSVADFSADSGFAERAAKFSCFGSRSFNERTNQMGLNNYEFLKNNSNIFIPLMEGGKLSRVSSSPSLKALGFQIGLKGRTTELAVSQKESTLSEQNPIGESKLKPLNDINSRKRKSVSKGKAKEIPLSSSPSTNSNSKVAETNDKDTNAKRFKPNESEASKTEEDYKKGSISCEEDEKQNKASPKTPEPPKDYIHVRARRGQATDSHSLAERVRREKISERMKSLQDLVPGCNKITGKALMLDEIINYVQSLQGQVEFLSMKLSSMNTRLEFNMNTSVSKDMYKSNTTLRQPIFPLDSSAKGIYGNHCQQNPTLHNISNGSVNHFSVDPLDSALCQLHLFNGFSDSVSQNPAFGEDDLQTLIQMGFEQNPNRESALQSHELPWFKSNVSNEN